MPHSLMNLALSLPNFGSTLLTLFGIGLVIFVHEAGHFLCARLCGVDVEVFSLGFGPRLFGWTRNGTDYRISAVPVGGYVKMLGDQPGEAEGDPRALHSKSVGQRFLVYSGGVIMNVLFALIAFPIIFAVGVELEKPAIGTVSPGGPAWRARLVEGDEVLQVNGRPMLGFADIALEIALSDPQDTWITIARDGEERLVQVHPEYSATLSANAIGIAQPFTWRVLVAPDGAAAAAGLADGDVLLEVDGQPASDRALRRLQSGEPVQLLVQRTGEAPRTLAITPSWRDSDEHFVIGIRRYENLVVGLRGAFAAQVTPIREGDRLLTFGGHAIATPDDLADAAAIAQAGPVALRLQREGRVVDAELSADLLATVATDVALSYARPGAAAEDAPREPVPIQVSPDTAAADAGLADGMLVLAIDGRDIDTWEGIQKAVEASQGAAMVLRIRTPAGDVRELTVTPRPHRSADYGFDLEAATVVRQYGLAEACRMGGYASWNLARQVYVTLRKMMSRQISATNLGGPVAITKVSYHFAQSGLARFFYFLALLSINLAVVNILPIPILDGGHLLFLLIEKVKGSPVDDAVMGYSQMFGLVIILSLLIFVTYNDIVKLVQ